MLAVWVLHHQRLGGVVQGIDSPCHLDHLVYTVPFEVRVAQWRDKKARSRGNCRDKVVEVLRRYSNYDDRRQLRM